MNTSGWMVLLQGDMHGTSLDRPALIRQAVSCLTASGASGSERLGLVEAIPPGDSWSRDGLRSAQRGEVHFYPFADVWANGLPLHAGQTWVTTRYHAHLLAASLGCRGVALTVDPDYQAAQHASLRDLGTGWAVLPAAGTAGSRADDIASATADTAFPGRALEVGRRKVALAERLYPAVGRTSRHHGVLSVLHR